MRRRFAPVAAAAVALVAASCGGSSSSSSSHRCGHVYVADPIDFYGYYYVYGYDPYYDDPAYWSYDDGYDDSTDDPGADDPSYDDPGTGDESDLLTKSSGAAVATTKGFGAADANGCYACVLECDVTTGGGPAREIANGVSATSDDAACGWAHKAMDAWAGAHSATVNKCARIDPRRTPSGATPAPNDAGSETSASDATPFDTGADAGAGADADADPSDGG